MLHSSLFFVLLFTLTIQAPKVSAEELDIYLGDFCQDELEKKAKKPKELSCKDESLSPSKLEELVKVAESTISFGTERNIEEVCQILSTHPDQKIELDLRDDDDGPWKIRFHFGFSRTFYNPTDLNLDAPGFELQVKDVKMLERTSANHYDPKNWFNGESKPFQWIDEPTNTFTLSFEKNKNVIYVTAFHPKYLKSLRYSNQVIDGKEVKVFEDMVHTRDFSTPLPEGYSEVYIGNTHRNMVWQVGYGREITLLQGAKGSELRLTPRVDVGIATGQVRTVHITPGVRWDDYYDDKFIQGTNASVGGRLEYQRGRVSAFVEHKTTFSQVEHKFLDGKVDYNLNYSNLTFGVGIDIFNKKRKK